jgi:hypothetical protein
MTESKLLSVALATAVMLATPAMACTSHVTSWHPVADAYASSLPTAHDISGPGSQAPHVGAFVAAPSGAGTCDVGDDPHIC